MEREKEEEVVEEDVNPMHGRRWEMKILQYKLMRTNKSMKRTKKTTTLFQVLLGRHCSQTFCRSKQVEADNHCNGRCCPHNEVVEVSGMDDSSFNELDLQQ